MAMRLWLCHLIILCVLQDGTTQFADMRWRHLGSKEGFPHYSEGHQIIQDHFGRIWMSYENGLHCYDGNDLIRYTRKLDDENSLPEDAVRALFEDADHRIWVSTMDMGIVVFDPFTSTFRRILPKKHGGPLPIGRIWSILEDSEGMLWLAGKPGLVRYDRSTDTYAHFVYHAPGYSELQLEYFNVQRCIVEDPVHPQRFYIGTRSGLFSFDKRTEDFTHHKMPDSGMTYLDPVNNAYMITSLLFTHDSLLWMTSWSGGVLLYNTTSHNWQQFRDPHIRDDFEVGWRLRPRNDRTLWIGDAFDFGVFDIVDHTFHYADFSPPVDSRELRFCLDFIFTPDSTVLLHGRRGLFIGENYSGYNPEKESFAPLLTLMTVNGEVLEADTSAAFIRNIQLEEYENDLTFRVSWPVFTNADKVRYQFMLEGHDTHWIDNGFSNIRQYPNLGNGNYTLHFRAGRGEGSWKEGLTHPSIRIPLPFWKEPWFVGSVALVMLGIFYSMHRLRVRQVKREERLKAQFNAQLADQEMSTLRAQMNPHFMFNSLNSIKTFILKEKTEEASGYLTKFSQLMRAVLRNSKSTLVTLEEELRTLQLYVDLEALRFEDEFEYSIVVDPALEDQTVFVPPLLIQPYVENAIRHGLLEKEEAPRLLQIEVAELTDGKIRISVEDNGIGRAQAMQKNRFNADHKKSYGMQITKDRIELIQKTLGIQAEVDVYDLAYPNGRPRGTRVEISIPYIENAEFAETNDQMY